MKIIFLCIDPDEVSGCAALANLGGSGGGGMLPRKILGFQMPQNAMLGFLAHFSNIIQ